MISSKTLPENDYFKAFDSILRLTLFWKLVIFWAVIGFSENFTVKAPKCNYHGKNKITR